MVRLQVTGPLFSAVMSQRASDQLGAVRTSMWQIGVFAIIGLLLAAIGLILGLPAATYVSRLIRDLLRGTRPADPLVYAIVCAGLFAVSLRASRARVRRVTRVDPLIALQDG